LTYDLLHDDDLNGIGTLNEKPLHAGLRAWYARPGDRFEVPVEGYVIDLVRGDLLVEIQTANFAALKRKLPTLTRQHSVRLVYPVAYEKWIVKHPADGETPTRRKSPKRGSYLDVFAELVRLPTLLTRANFALHVLLIQEEEVRRHEPGRAWRRKGWVIDERRLLAVVEDRLFEHPADLLALLPESLPRPFTTADLAAVGGLRKRLAGQVAYCLRKMDMLEAVGKRGNAILYVPVPD
jgi:hypothetical protein